MPFYHITKTVIFQGFRWDSTSLRKTKIQLRKFLAIIAFFIFCSDSFSQIKGDSVQIESTYGKKYTGTISKVDQEGYFIKTSYNREIFLSKLEIKTIKVVLEWVEPDVDTKASILLQTQMMVIQMTPMHKKKNLKLRFLKKSKAHLN